MARTLDELAGIVSPDPAPEQQPIQATPGTIPANLPSHIVEKVGEAPNEDRSEQTFALVAVCVEWGLSDAETLACLAAHRPSAEKYGGRLTEQGRAVLAKVRPQHDHVGKPCDRAECPNAPTWMSGPEDAKRRKAQAAGKPRGKKKASDVAGRPQEKSSPERGPRVTDEAAKVVGTEPEREERQEPERYSHSRIDWPALWARDPTDTDWLAEPLLPGGGRSTALYAPAKGGKSLLALDVAARLATGRRVLDRTSGDPVRVLYIDAEMTEDDLRDRLEDMGFDPTDDLSAFAYYLLPDLPPLDTPEGGRDLRILADAHDADLVVIDTCASTTTGKENDSDTIRDYHRHTGRFLRADGRAALRIDHAGKDLTRGQRGTSAKAGDVDLVWEMTPRDGDTFRLRATHRRMGWVPPHVDVVRLTDPLRHELVIESYPAGTEETAAHLDTLGLPLDAGGRRARRALRDAGHSASNEVIAAAVRYRRGTPE